MKQTIVQKRNDGKPLTIENLSEFVQAVQAHEGHALVTPKARVSFGGQLKSISAEIDDDPGRPTDL